MNYIEQATNRTEEIKKKINLRNKQKDIDVFIYDVTKFSQTNPKLEYNTEVEVKIYAVIVKESVNGYVHRRLDSIYTNVTNDFIKSDFHFEFQRDGKPMDIIITNFEYGDILKCMIDAFNDIDTSADMSWDWDNMKIN